jgi:hypothetical protein
MPRTGSIGGGTVAEVVMAPTVSAAQRMEEMAVAVVFMVVQVAFRFTGYYGIWQPE